MVNATTKSESLQKGNGVNNKERYWQKNLQYLAVLLAVWFVVSFGCSILFVNQLDQVKIGGFHLGFWFAQQGSIYVFVLLIFIYVLLMNRLDKKHGLDDQSESIGHKAEPKSNPDVESPE